MQTMKDDIYWRCIDLILPVWKTIDVDFKSRYRQTIWDIFEFRVQLAAGQNGTLSRFISQLARSLGSNIGSNAEQRQAALKAVKLGEDREVLRILREETPYVILIMRVELQKEKELYDNEN